ncbi:MAG: energy transducer TonB [Acidobacteriota bacterium]
MRRRFLHLIVLSATVWLWDRGRAEAQTPRPVAEAEGGAAKGEVMPNAELHRLPDNEILVRGAEPSATDHVTPLPEEGRVAKDVYRSSYFALEYPLPEAWTETVKGPPPSDSGRYVLAQLTPTAKLNGPSAGTVLVMAQDLFFSHGHGSNAMDVVNYSKEHLPAYYEVEHPPVEVKIADRSFARFDYRSPVAQLHWYVLATEIRCHAVEFIFAGQDTAVLDGLVRGMNRVKLPAEAGIASGMGGGEAPTCIADYAAENVIEKVDPVLQDRRFNPIPVRITIDKKGKVRHVHVISAFPDQASRITDALLQWRFKPYMQNGQPVEVETGIMFGTALPRARTTPATRSAAE